MVREFHPRALITISVKTYKQIHEIIKIKLGTHGSNCHVARVGRIRASFFDLNVEEEYEKKLKKMSMGGYGQWCNSNFRFTGIMDQQRTIYHTVSYRNDAAIYRYYRLIYRCARTDAYQLNDSAGCGIGQGVGYGIVAATESGENRRHKKTH